MTDTTVLPRVYTPAPSSLRPWVAPTAPECIEPDWQRIPGYRHTTRAEWEDATWQRKHSIKNVRELKTALGPLLPDALAASIEQDQRERATMPLLLPPHVLNTMVLDDLWLDPIRRYMLPAFDDRQRDWPNHPEASSDSLHEQEMWAVEGLTHRYPNKALVELLSTCPQYCGHCTRMHLVGKSVPQVSKVQFKLPPRDRQRDMLGYLRRTPAVRDVVVSGGDLANVPLVQLEGFIGALLDIPHIRDVRMASKGLIGLPQHYLQPEVLDGFARLATKARERGVKLALHTHANHAQQVTPLVARASRLLLDTGLRDIRNQGVLLDGVNATVDDLLRLCLALIDHTQVMPYYLYMCDMIPNAEHWRISLAHAQELQYGLMGLLPGFATPRIVCDVPYVGKRWVHQVATYDRVRGISHWTPGAATALAHESRQGESGRYFDPLHTLPPEGREWWRARSLRNTPGQPA